MANIRKLISFLFGLRVGRFPDVLLGPLLLAVFGLVVAAISGLLVDAVLEGGALETVTVSVPEGDPGEVLAQVEEVIEMELETTDVPPALSFEVESETFRYPASTVIQRSGPFGSAVLIGWNSPIPQYSTSTVSMNVLLGQKGLDPRACVSLTPQLKVLGFEVQEAFISLVRQVCRPERIEWKWLLKPLSNIQGEQVAVIALQAVGTEAPAEEASQQETAELTDQVTAEMSWEFSILVERQPEPSAEKESGPPDATVGIRGLEDSDGGWFGVPWSVWVVIITAVSSILVAIIGTIAIFVRRGRGTLAGTPYV